MGCSYLEILGVISQSLGIQKLKLLNVQFSHLKHGTKVWPNSKHRRSGYNSRQFNAGFKNRDWLLTPLGRIVLFRFPGSRSACGMNHPSGTPKLDQPDLMHNPSGSCKSYSPPSLGLGALVKSSPFPYITRRPPPQVPVEVLDWQVDIFAYTNICLRNKQLKWKKLYLL